MNPRGCGQEVRSFEQKLPCAFATLHFLKVDKGALLSPFRRVTAGMPLAVRLIRPIVTEVVPLKAFYAAESYHQNYATLHPDNPYIARNDAPKVEHLRQQFPDLYKK